MRKDFLLPFKPSIGEAEIKEVVDSLKSGWVTTGPKTKKFEEQFAKYVGSRYAIAVSSCTAALHLSLVALGIKRGDEVITSPMTFASTANVIMHLGAKPIFVDIEERSMNLDVNKIEKAITNKTKAIIPVHYGGHACEMDHIKKIAEKYNLKIIEDAAHAIGSSYKGKKIGGIGDLTCFSFYATKNMTTGEGGMITTNDEKLAEKMNVLRLHGISKDAWKRYSSEGSWFYEILYPGYKYNMTDIQSALGLHQLKRLDKMKKQKEQIVKIYDEGLSKIKEIDIPYREPINDSCWHLYVIKIKLEELKINRAEFIEELKGQNIGTSVHFIPLHMHPFYSKFFGFKKGDFPIAEKVYSQIISLPLFSDMKKEDARDVINAIKNIINNNRQSNK